MTFFIINRHVWAPCSFMVGVYCDNIEIATGFQRTPNCFLLQKPFLHGNIDFEATSLFQLPSGIFYDASTRPGGPTLLYNRLSVTLIR